MTDSHNPFFKLDDFQNLEMSIEGVNSTSQVKMSGFIGIVQILEDGMWLDVSAKSCSEGHALSLKIAARKFTGNSKRRLPSGETVEEKDYSENRMQITGVVEQVQAGEEGRIQARLKFRQYSQ